MPEYMLDTDTVSFALRGQGRVAARLLEHRPSQLCISSISLAEHEKERMSEQVFMEPCFMCCTQFRTGVGVYSGKHIGRHEISVCNERWDGKLGWLGAWRIPSLRAIQLALERTGYARRTEGLTARRTSP